MRIIVLILFLFYYESVFGQFRDVETKFYDLFVFSSNSFLVGNEDLQYHPARINYSSNYLINMKTNYHDVFREWGGNNDNNKTIYQYDFGLETEIPINLFKKNCCLNLSFLKQTFLSAYNSENKEAEFVGSHFGAYSFNSNLLFDETPDKVGLRIKYSTGINSLKLRINQYPESETDALLNKYFYNLLEPAFGKDIRFDLAGDEINYAIEYNRILNSSFNFGFNFYQEMNDYDIGINYYSSIAAIEGLKKLYGLLQFNRYTFGSSCEYRMNNFIIRVLATYSVPFYKLMIDQNSSLIKDSVNLEIKKLSDGSCNGKGRSFGVGISYLITQNMAINISYTFIQNNYYGKLYASTPVLGYEIFLPIAHQLNMNFDDKMNNNLFSFVFNHSVSSIWNYSIGMEYLTSDNSVHYNYKITEFGIGITKEESDYNGSVFLYKFNVNTMLNITNNIGVKLLFDQYIPIIKKRGGEVNIPSQSLPPSEIDKFDKNKWGGSIYSLSLFYNFN